MAGRGKVLVAWRCCCRLGPKTDFLWREGGCESEAQLPLKMREDQRGGSEGLSQVEDGDSLPSLPVQSSSPQESAGPILLSSW